MWAFIIKQMAKNDNSQEISLFDVKELYDAAYDEKAKARVNLTKFKLLIKQAEKLDAAYRFQLAQSSIVRKAA